MVDAKLVPSPDVLACLLWAYEADEPHVSSPGLDVGAEEKQHYPVLTPELLGKYLAGEHLGDCTGQASSCVRCAADAVWHKANWMAARLGFGGS